MHIDTNHTNLDTTILHIDTTKLTLDTTILHIDQIYKMVDESGGGWVACLPMATWALPYTTVNAAPRGSISFG